MTVIFGMQHIQKTGHYAITSNHKARRIVVIEKNNAYKYKMSYPEIRLPRQTR